MSIRLRGGGEDVDTVFTLTATGTGSSVIVQGVTPAAAATLDSLVLVSSSSGVVSFTAADNNLTITSIDATAAAANGVVINVSNLAAATEITLGAGNATVTTSDNADTVTSGTGNVTINVTAGGEFNFGSGVETNKALTSASTDIYDFDVDSDVIVLDISVLESAAFTSTSDLVNYNGDGLTVLSAVVIAVETGGAAFSMDAASILRLSGNYADTAAVEAAIEGDMEDLSLADEDSIVVIWSDGANAHISLFEIDAVNTAGSGVVDTVTHNGEIVELVGIDASTLTAANFSIVA